MPALDLIHDKVKNALAKDGWTITFDPYRIKFLDALVYADLGAQYPLGARRGTRKIVVETKSFLGLSPMQEFKLALGQFLLYRAFLEQVAADHEMDLAVSVNAYDSFFQKESIRYVTERYDIALI